jgi:hypothetical protein
MKYLELVKGLFTAEHEARAKQEDPYVAYSKEADKFMFNLPPEPVTGPTDNEIWYTSTRGNVINPADTDVFGANIVSNTYEDGKGVITFDGPVTSIGDAAFDFCTGLVSITIPKSVTSIGNMAFVECASLTYVTCLATTPPDIDRYSSIKWINTNEGALYVPSESVEAYKSHRYWGECADIQPI